MHDGGNCGNPLSFAPIGIIHSPFTDITGMPIQPNGARGIRGTVKIFEEFKDGLKDIEGFPDSSLSMRFIAASHISSP